MWEYCKTLIIPQNKIISRYIYSISHKTEYTPHVFVNISLYLYQLDAVCGTWFDPFNLCSNADSTHTSIFKRHPLNMMLSTCTQLLWWSRWGPFWAEPVLLNHQHQSEEQSSSSVGHPYIEQQFFSSDPQRVLCHEVPCELPVASVREFKSDTKFNKPAPNSHLRPCNTMSHMLPLRENG